MRTLLIFLLVIVVAVGALGFYLGWFEFGSSTGPEGRRDIKLTIDPNKVKSTVTGVEERIKKAVGGGTTKQGQQ
jgi:hypothetical protein